MKPLIDDGTLRGEAHALGQMLWASTHGLVMLRLSGIVADDAELRELHQKTMSALVRGADPVTTFGRGATVLKVSGRAPARKAKRKTP